jgi:hypothetical protein
MKGIHPFEDNPALYSESPEIRFRASAELNEAEPNSQLLWPYGFWGAANPWLVLLGPSPGRDIARETRGPEFAENLFPNIARYGPAACEITFDDGSRLRRNKAWRSLRIAAFEAAGLSNERASIVQAQLTALMNLGFENAAAAARGTDAEARRIASFADTLLPRLMESRPAVIVVLSKVAWTPFEAALQSLGRIVEQFPAAEHPAPSRVRKPMKRLLIRIADDLPYLTSVILSPVHPSMQFSRGVDDRAIISPLAELLGKARARKSQH